MCTGRHSQGGAEPQGCRSPGSAAATVLVIRIQRRKTLPVVKPSRRGRRGTSSRSTWQVLPSAPLVPGTHPDGVPGHVPAAPPPAQATPADGQLCFSFFFKNRNKNILSRTRLLFHALSRRVTLGRGTGPEWGWRLPPRNPERHCPGGSAVAAERRLRGALHGAPFFPDRRLRPLSQRPPAGSHSKPMAKLKQEAGGAVRAQCLLVEDTFFFRAASIS